MSNEMKWVRRNLIALWDGQPYETPEDREANMAECDRILIALHRFQTKGQVAYRRLLGMHGGGGGTSDNGFRDILTKKVQLDIENHYGGNFPQNGYWPEPVPNATPPQLVTEDNPDRAFAYTFCWHAQPEFLIWHRAITAEFERGLQQHDPYFDGCSDPSDRHKDHSALGAPYWAWEGWDGLTLPQTVGNSIYVIKTDKWEKQGYPKGSVFPNPYHRWFSPVSLEGQRVEYFPTTLNSGNTTTRAAAFDDPGSEFSQPWEQITSSKKPSMEYNVYSALLNRNWLKFCTMNADVGGGNLSIENAHNKFHNHVGGITMGGVQGSGKQIDSVGLEYTGTMGQNQSIFDPMFWLHHSNVERQLCSWQKLHITGTAEQYKESVPSEALMKTVLYPWTKPNYLFSGRLSWNTPASKDADATFGDWFDHTTLPYIYDDYLLFNDDAARYKGNPMYGGLTPPSGIPIRNEDEVRMKVYFSIKFYKSGEFALYFTASSTTKRVLVSTISVLSSSEGVCGRCGSRRKCAVGYDVTETFPTVQAAEDAWNKDKSGKLSLTRNDSDIEITDVKVEKWFGDDEKN